MAGIPWDTIITSGAGFAGGLLDDSDELEAESRVKSAAYNARYAYPGQKALGGKVSSYLWENLGMGLTEPEKRMMRGAGRTGILQGVKSATADTTKQAASQGLRGGAIANIIKNLNQSKIPAFGKLESDISMKDAELKRKRISDILTYLSLSAGYGEDAPAAGSGGSIADIINGLYGSGGTGMATGGVGPGGGNAPPTTSAGLNIGGNTAGKGLATAGFAIPGIGALIAAMAKGGAFEGEPGNIADLTESGYGVGGGGYSGGGYGMPGSAGVGGIW